MLVRNSPNKRPELQDAYSPAAKSILQSLITWVEADGDTQTPDQIKELQEHLEKAISICGHNLDGYQLAKSLEEDFYYEPDAQLVELLDDAAKAVYEEHAKLVRDWVIQYDITPDFTIDAKVTFKHRGTLHTGVISGINREDAKYHIYCAALGHVKQGSGTHAAIQAYELTESIEQPHDLV